jgi:ribosomal protein S18 acetylase RimI-like enzyme
MQYKFSISKPEDLAEVKAINVKCMPENYSMEIHQQLIDSTLICRCQATNKIVGYAIMANLATDDDALMPFSRKHSTEDVFIHTSLFSIAVLEEYRKSGIGAKLLKIIIGAHKKNPIVLHVRKSNLGAIHMYNKFGFQLVREIPEFYFNPVETGLCMVLNDAAISNP